MNEENSLRWETESSFWLNVVKVEVNFEERIRLAMDGREQRSIDGIVILWIRSTDAARTTCSGSSRPRRWAANYYPVDDNG